jgi:hypothetical protein
LTRIAGGIGEEQGSDDGQPRKQQAGQERHLAPGRHYRRRALPERVLHPVLLLKLPRLAIVALGGCSTSVGPAPTTWPPELEGKAPGAKNAEEATAAVATPGRAAALLAALWLRRPRCRDQLPSDE